MGNAWSVSPEPEDREWSRTLQKTEQSTTTMNIFFIFKNAAKSRE